VAVAAATDPHRLEQGGAGLSAFNGMTVLD